MLDAFRADSVLSKRNGKDLTPNLKKILNNSLYFKNCIINSTWTLPTHISMFTGLYTTQIKLISSVLHKLSYKLPILTEIIRNMGYYTLCYTENPWINPFFRLTRGFNHVFRNCRRGFQFQANNKFYRDLIDFLNKIDSILMKIIKFKKGVIFWKNFKNNIEKMIKKIEINLYWKTWLFDYKNTLTLLDLYSNFLKNKNKDNPKYLFFNIMGSHYPYLPIKKALNYCNFKNRDFNLLKDFLLNIRENFFTINIKSQRLSEKKIKVLKKLYDSCVYYNDLIIGKIFLILENLGLLENSYVIITADHGEHLGDRLDHYFYGHGVDQSAFESLVKVPLIIFNSNFKTKIIKEQIAQIDLFHTILHLTGLVDKENKYMDIKKSIFYQIDNKKTPKYIYGEHLRRKSDREKLFNRYKNLLSDEQISKLTNNMYFLRSNKYKYIRFGNEIEEFYDLYEDPYEQSNIINKNPPTYKEMKSYLGNFIKDIKNTDNIEKVITEREKDRIRKSMYSLKI